MMNETVYIMLDTEIGKKVVKARDYQEEAFNHYINTNTTQEIKYEKKNIKFSITKFDSIKYGLSGEYLDVYCFVKENNQFYLISQNFNKLSKLCGFINRVTS